MRKKNHHRGLSQSGGTLGPAGRLYQRKARLFESLVPLPEVIGASEGRSATSAKVQREYQRMLKELGPEFEILRRIPIMRRSGESPEAASQKGLKDSERTGGEDSRI